MFAMSTFTAIVIFFVFPLLPLLWKILDGRPRNEAERKAKEERDEWLRENEPRLYYGHDHDHWDYHG